MSDASGMRVVGTSRSIELYASMAKFQSVAPRQVARIVLEAGRMPYGAEEGAELLASEGMGVELSEAGLDVIVPG